MIKKRELDSYCKKNLLNYTIDDTHLYIDSKAYSIVSSEQKIFDEDFNFLPAVTSNSDGYVYEFCGHWYVQSGDEVTMQRLLYLGESKQKLKTTSFLGIHSGNELLNGVGVYKDWVKKAKFLKVENLGICEKNNIGGSMEFQKECLSNDIKPIFGMSFDVVNGDVEYSVKCYARDFQGWQNLLKFNYLFNVENEPKLSEKFLQENKEGLFIIVDPKNSKFLDYSHITQYYQLDTVVFEEEQKDISYLKELKGFLKSDMKPVLLCDAYYIEQNEWRVREKLWGIAKSFDFKTKNQYFKSNDEVAMELINMFEPGNKSWVKLYKEAEQNLNFISDNCNFIYDTTSRHLPKYVMTEEEAKAFDTKEELFIHLVKEGLKDKNISNKQSYIDRLKEEISILKSGDVIDYFLVLHDIIKFANKEDILVGIGRGSAGGSLVSYLLGIIRIDPIEFNLLFERFLNKGRMGSLVECDAYEIETENGTIKLNEKSILKVNRNKKEVNIFVEDLEEGDIILKY